MLPHALLPLFLAGVTLQSSLDSVVQRRKLANGLEVIVVENPAVPLATALLAVRNGAFTQDTDEVGLAHLYEHLLFRSFGHSPEDFAIEVGKLKGGYGATTGEEVVRYFLTVPSQNIEPAIELLSRLMINAHFSNGDLKAERSVVLDELQRNVSDPGGDLDRQVRRALWGSAWNRKDVGGDSASLQRISMDRLRAAYARYYVPNNAALIVTGDVEPARIFAAAEKEFGDWKGAPNPFADRPIPPVPPLAHTTAVMVARDVLDVTIVVAMDGPSVTSDAGATYAADVLFDVLNDGTSGFQQRLVEGGPFESVSAYYAPLTHTGSIEFRGTATPQNAKKAILALIGELQRLDVLDGVTDDDLAIARKRRQVGAALARERISSLAPALASWWSSAGVENYLDYDEHTARQTADSLRRFAQGYITRAPRVIGVLGAPAEVTAIGDWLRQGGRAP